MTRDEERDLRIRWREVADRAPDRRPERERLPLRVRDQVEQVGPLVVPPRPLGDPRVRVRVLWVALGLAVALIALAVFALDEVAVVRPVLAAGGALLAASSRDFFRARRDRELMDVGGEAAPDEGRRPADATPS